MALKWLEPLDPTDPVPAAPAVNAQYVHWDHLGSTRLMTDEKGAEIGHWKYYPFGLEAESSGGADNRMKFTGHERDGELGLDYMLARYYGNKNGRFIATDPGNDRELEVPPSWNAYAYVRNNPLNATDPTGMVSDVMTGVFANPEAIAKARNNSPPVTTAQAFRNLATVATAITVVASSSAATAAGAGFRVLAVTLLKVGEGASYAKLAADAGSFAVEPSKVNAIAVGGDVLGLGVVGVGHAANRAIFSAIVEPEIKTVMDASVQFVGINADRGVCSVWDEESTVEPPDEASTGEAAKADKNQTRGTSGR
jgi:RHS repeat-associated protein